MSFYFHSEFVEERSSLQSSWALSIVPKVPELSKRGKWQGNFLETFPENRRIGVYFSKMQIIHPFRNSVSKMKWNGSFQYKILETLGVPHEVLLFQEIQENAAPFTHGNFRDFNSECFVEWKTPLDSTYKTKCKFDDVKIWKKQVPGKYSFALHFDVFRDHP